MVEMMTVLLVLSVLIVLASMGMKAVSRKTQSAQCLANLRILGGGLLAWSADHDHRLPSRQRRDGDGKRIYNWMEALERGGYVGGVKRPDNRLFYCPSRAKPQDSSEGYGMRQWGAHVASVRVTEDAELPLALIEQPSRFFLLADSAKRGVGGLVQWYTIQQGSQNNGVFLAHHHRANAVFADGHAEAADRSYFETHHLLEPAIFRATDSCSVISPE